MARGRLVVVVGLPGAGKTTLARSVAAAYGAERMCPDEELARLGVDLFDEERRAEVEAGMADRAARVLAAGGRVVVEFGSWSREDRDRLLALGRAAGAAVELRVLDPGVEELWRRLARRNTEPGEAVIDRATLEGHLGSWEPPTPAECARYDPPAGGATGRGPR